MTQDLQLTLMYEQGINLCGVTLADGEQKVLPIEQLNDPELEDMVQEDSLESARLQIDGDMRTDVDVGAAIIKACSIWSTGKRRL